MSNLISPSSLAVVILLLPHFVFLLLSMFRLDARVGSPKHRATDYSAHRLVDQNGQPCTDPDGRPWEY